MADGGCDRAPAALAAILLLGLFLMHGLQTFCNDTSASGHDMGKPVGVALAVEPSSRHSESMTMTVSGREVAGRLGSTAHRLDAGVWRLQRLGRAPAGQFFPLTLNVTGAGVAKATVWVSYDEGKTWTTVPVSDATGEWVARVRDPRRLTNPWVALRVVVTDGQGDTGGWTAIRSYRIAALG